MTMTDSRSSPPEPDAKYAATASGSSPAAREGDSLNRWIDQQLRASLDHMKRAISATKLTRERSDFFQEITPKRGSVVAWPNVEENVQPDYFFHWLRDSALVMNALALAIERGHEDAAAIQHLHDFVEFSLEINRANGPALLATKGAGRTSRPELARYLRTYHELEVVVGDRVLMDARFNPDGSLDILKWARPQYDGAALRALTVLRHLPLLEQGDAKQVGAAQALLGADLAFISRHFRDPCYDIWERRFGHHYHTRAVCLSALRRGAAWARGVELAGEAEAYEAAARELERVLDHHWSQQGGFYLSAIKGSQTPADQDLDSAALLAMADAGLASGRHSVHDPRAQATLERLEDLFASLFPINRKIGAGDAPLLGRFRGDGYFGGGVFLMSALGAAEAYYRLASHVRMNGAVLVEPDNRRFLKRCGLLELREGAPDFLPRSESERALLAGAFRRRGDSIMAALSRFTPPSGALPEQIDKTDGAPASARNLAWSHAAFITAFAARAKSL